MKGRIMIFAHIMAILWPSTLTIDQNCNFKQDMEVGKSYYIYQPEYPANYKGRHSCQWAANSPPNTKIQLYCESVDIVFSDGCEYDRLTVSTSGSTNLQDGHFYCGSGTLSINSEYNAMTIGFFSAANTPGGRFVCTIKAFSTVNQNCDCGWHNTRRIVGGENTLINEYPMMAALVDYTIAEVFCGATIISNNYAVTAAHCLAKRLGEVKNTGLLVGDWNVNIGSDTPAAKIYNISKFIVNQNYQARNYVNDIALVKTVIPIIYTLEIGPACLPLSYTTANFEGQRVTVLGWGATGFGDAPSNILQKVDLDWIPLQTCKQTFSSVTDNQFCTYRQGKDSCQGDSGGPALWQSVPTSRIQLLGIISFGSGCALDKSPGTNTRVSQYINWIRSQTPEEYYCTKL